MVINKKIIALISLTFLFLIFVLLIINFDNNRVVTKTDSPKISQKNDIEPKEISKNNNCKIPKRNNTKCSELSLEECKNNTQCYQRGKSCFTPPQSYIDTLGIIKENCEISNGQWSNSTQMYLNKFGVCECPADSKEMFPDDGFCGDPLLGIFKKKKLPEDFYKYYDVLHNRQNDFQKDSSSYKIINGVVVDLLTVSMNKDYANMDEAEYIACLFDGKVVGRVFLIDGYQIEFKNKTEEDAVMLADKIENEPTVDFVLIDVEMVSDDLEEDYGYLD